MQISVSTHNRKIVRLRKIFATLQEYREDGNPFSLKVLMRKEREKQEEQLRAVLDDPRFHLINKEEIKVIFYIGMYTGQQLKDCVLLQ